jgi:hypothetical protein
LYWIECNPGVAVAALPVGAEIPLPPGSGTVEAKSRTHDEIMLDISVHPGFPYLDSTSRSICAGVRRKLCILTSQA